MKFFTSKIAALPIAAVLAAWAFAAADSDERHPGDSEKTVKLSEIPAEAQSAIRREAGTASVTEVEEEIEAVAKVYTASWESGGVGHAVTVTPTGDVVERETSVQDADIPEAVRRAAMKRLTDSEKPKFRLKTIVLYEVEADAENRQDGEEIELLIDPAGRFMELQVEDDGEAEESESDDADEDAAE